LVASFFLAQI